MEASLPRLQRTSSSLPVASPRRAMSETRRFVAHSRIAGRRTFPSPPAAPVRSNLP